MSASDTTRYDEATKQEIPGGNFPAPDASCDSFPSLLRDATYVSSKGRIYRLFSEEEETALGESFSLHSVDDPIPMPEREIETYPATASGPPDTASPRPELPLEEKFKRIRAVQGVCGRNQMTVHSRIIDALSQSGVSCSNPSARTQVPLKKQKLEDAGEIVPKSETRGMSEKPGTALHPDVPASRPRQNATSRKCPLMEPETAVRVESFAQATLVPILEGTPDFIETRSCPAGSSKHETAVDSDPGPEYDTNENLSSQEDLLVGPPSEPTGPEPSCPDPSVAETEQEPLDRSIRLVRLELPDFLRKKFFRAVFTRRRRYPVRPSVAENDEPIPCILKWDDHLPQTATPSKSTNRFQEDDPLESPPVPDNETETENGAGRDTAETTFVREIASEEFVSETIVREIVARSSLVSEAIASEQELTGPVTESPEVSWKVKWPRDLDSMSDPGRRQIRALCDHLVRQKQEGKRIVSFNGFYPGEGCTTIALCVARELAARGLHVLLADANGRNPEIPKLLDIPFDPELYEIVILGERLEFLPWSGDAIEVEREGVLRMQSFGELVASLRSEFDMILLDNGRLSEGPLVERIRLWREMNSDGVLLVFNPHGPRTVPLEAVVQKLRENDVDLLGISENNHPIRKRKSA